MRRICPYCDSRVVKKNHNGVTYQCVYCRHVFSEDAMESHLKKQVDSTTHATLEKGNKGTRSM